MNISNIIIETTKDTNEKNNHKEIHNVVNDYKKQCKNIISDKELNNILDNKNTNFNLILKHLLKKNKKVNCCNNIDMSKFVLKTSTPPCSNTISSEKLKKILNKPKKDKKDNFSIIYLSIIILIITIILIKLL